MQEEMRTGKEGGRGDGEKDKPRGFPGSRVRAQSVVSKGQLPNEALSPSRMTFKQEVIATFHRHSHLQQQEEKGFERTP